MFRKLKIFRELWRFTVENKKFVLLPVATILILFGLLLVFAQGSAFAPFIYTLF